MHLPPLRLAGLVLTFAVRTLAAEPLLEKVDVFEAGTNGVALYRIPGVVVTAKGTVLAYCEARKSSGADWGEIEVHLRRSSDGGRTWDAARQIAHLGERMPGNPHKAVGGESEQTVNNPVAIVDRQTGAGLFCSFLLVPKVGLWERTIRGAILLRGGWPEFLGAFRPPLTAKHSFPAMRAFPKPHFGNEQRFPDSDWPHQGSGGRQ